MISSTYRVDYALEMYNSGLNNSFLYLNLNFGFNTETSFAEVANGGIEINTGYTLGGRQKVSVEKI